MRYSRRHLDGEAREGRFHGVATIAVVLVLVQAAILPVLVASFVATGVVLRQLLLSFPERVAAHRAATKFIRVRGTGDLALIAAALLL